MDRPKGWVSWAGWLGDRFGSREPTGYHLGHGTWARRAVLFAVAKRSMVAALVSGEFFRQLEVQNAGSELEARGGCIYVSTVRRSRRSCQF
jgi:hypothetical protein